MRVRCILYDVLAAASTYKSSQVSTKTTDNQTEAYRMCTRSQQDLTRLDLTSTSMAARSAEASMAEAFLWPDRFREGLTFAKRNENTCLVQNGGRDREITD